VGVALQHLAFVTASYPRFAGGGSRVVYEHANRLAAAGFGVRVVHSIGIRPGLAGLPDRARDMARSLRTGHLARAVRWMDVDRRVEVLVVDRLEDLGHAPPTDVFVATFWSTSRALSLWGDPSTPVLQLMQAYEDWAAPAEAIEQIWRLPSHKAVVSESLRQRGLSLGVPADRLHLVPNGLDLDTYRVSVPPEARGPHLAFLVHDAPVKGLDVALEVVEEVRKRVPQGRMTAFGGIPRPSRLPDHVTYVHGRSGASLVSEVYDKASVFLVTSRSEGWGYPALEAMACGAAVVSTRNGGVDDFALDGVTARLCDVDDVAGLTAACVDLLTDPERRTAFATAGAARARAFTWERSHAAMVEALTTAWAAGPLGRVTHRADGG
jgi:L-malate glycosyltransferase